MSHLGADQTERSEFMSEVIVRERSLEMVDDVALKRKLIKRTSFLS